MRILCWQCTTDLCTSRYKLWLLHCKFYLQAREHAGISFMFIEVYKLHTCVKELFNYPKTELISADFFLSLKNNIGGQ